MFKLLLVSFLLFVSCASQSKEKYKLEPINNKYMTWRWCGVKDDLPNMPKISRTGKMCYWHKACRKRLFGKKCKPVLLTCSSTNIKCMEKYGIYDKEIF